MNARSRQAIRRILIGLGAFVALLVVVLAAGAVALDVRLARGPIPVTGLANWLAASAAGKSAKVRIGAATLGWSATSHRGGRPLELRLADIRAAAQGEAVGDAPAATIAFRPRALFGLSPFRVAAPVLHVQGTDAPVSVQAELHLGLGFGLRRTDALVTLGAGTVSAAGATEPIASAAFTIRLTASHALLRSGSVLMAQEGHSQPRLGLTGRFAKGAKWKGTLVMTVDRVQAVDLRAYWPASLAPGAHQWVAANISAGEAHDARFVFGLTAPRNLSSVDVSSVSGGYDADGVTMQALPGLTPFTGVSGHLTVPDEDTVTIVAGGRLGGLTVRPDSAMRITGLDKPVQVGTVSLHVAGTVDQAVAVLDGPPLNLRQTMPAMLNEARGNLTADASATLPLLATVTKAQVTYDATVRLADAATPLPGGLPDFTDGQAALHFDNRTAKLTGSGKLGGGPIALVASAKTADPAATFSFNVRTIVSAKTLSAAGLDAETTTASASNGGVPLSITATPLPGRRQKLVADADLTPATLGLPVLGWSKPAGAAGRLHLEASLANGSLASVDALDASGPGLAIEGRDRGGTIVFSRIEIGRTSATATVTPPSGGAGWVIAARGPMLDLRAILSPAKGAEAKQATPRPGPPSGPAWSATLAFAALALAAPPAPDLTGFSFTGSGKGSAVLTATATATEAGGQPVRVSIAPSGGTSRSFAINAGDGGTLLRSLGAYGGLEGGTIDLTGTYGSGAALIGTLDARNLTIRNVPHSLKVLQAASIYGAAAAATPGLDIIHLIAPFSIAQRTLTLSQARARARAIGFTASGTIALDTGDADLDATVIPAYGINALPTKIPLIGRLFSSQKGGGVFSIHARITGNLSDPKVNANPLSAATPGAAAKIFDEP